MPRTFLMSLFVLALSFGTVSAYAQNSGSSALGNAAIDAGKKILTEEAARQAGRYFTEEQKELIRDVLGAATGQSSGATDSRDEEETRRSEQDTGKGKGKAKGKGKGKSGKLPPGLAKKKELPPGLQKQLERGGTLPPGLAKRSLPDELDEKLGDPAEDTERVIVDNDVVLIEKGTGIILDVLEDVLSGGQNVN